MEQFYENLYVKEGIDSFYVYSTSTIATENNKQNELLIIDKIHNECRLSNDFSIIPIESAAITHQIYGIVGTIKLITGNYLIIVTNRTRVGKLNEHDIWRAESFDVIPYFRNEAQFNENEKKFNLTYKKMVETFLSTQHFYYSHTYDLTHSLQKLQDKTPEFSNQPVFERADKRFIWNYFLIKNLQVNNDTAHFFSPLMLGFVSINQVEINGKSFEFSLISRRSCLNAGTRFNVRGADEEGNVANFIETEQIITYLDLQFSYLIVRGSIPIFWSQKPNLKYKPSIVLDENKNQVEICRKHFQKSVQIYNKNVCVNLVNQHGSEGMLEKKFDNVIKSLNDPYIKYESFDFHKQCGNDKWDRLSILINRLANDQDAFGYFSASKYGNPLSYQRGIFRINCIDCLDRTNVVQGLLAKRILHIQLLKLNILSENESIESNEKFYNVFRNVWADNGDYLSIQYAGTGALKSDFTRLGKRTTYGMLRDGYNSLLRYYINNFNDGFRQDSIDLVLGNYKVMSNEGIQIEKCPVASDNSTRLLALPVIGLGTFSMFFISLLIPAETFQEQFTYVLFWGFATLCTLGVMLYYGKDIVNSPKLVHKIKNKNE